MLTVVLVAGVDATGLVLYAVGLTLDGPVDLRTVTAPGVAFAPPTAQPDVEVLLLKAPAAPDLPTLAKACGDRIRAAAAQNPALVSPDWEHVTVTLDAARVPVLRQHLHGDVRVARH